MNGWMDGWIRAPHHRNNNKCTATTHRPPPEIETERGDGQTDDKTWTIHDDVHLSRPEQLFLRIEIIIIILMSSSVHYQEDYCLYSYVDDRHLTTHDRKILFSMACYQFGTSTHKILGQQLLPTIYGYG